MSFRRRLNRSGFLSVLVLATISLALLTAAARSAFSQKSKPVPNAAPASLLKRTTTRHELRHFGYGGTFTIVGAPAGSITIEGWPRNEVDITAEIELQAETESDFDLLAAVNNFFLDEDSNHLSILTSGTHDKTVMRRAGKNFPKRLLGLPWKIDYHVRVPTTTDLDINGGRGAISLSGVEGAIKLTSPQTEAALTVTGGVLVATVALGKVNLSVPQGSWHGSGCDVQLAAGELTVELPPGFSGDIDAEILRTGRIENAFPGLEAREQPGLTARNIRGRSGAGGAVLKFTVGDGTIYLKKKSEEQ